MSKPTNTSAIAVMSAKTRGGDARCGGQNLLGTKDEPMASRHAAPVATIGRALEVDAPTMKTTRRFDIAEARGDTFRSIGHAAADLVDGLARRRLVAETVESAEGCGEGQSPNPITRAKVSGN